MVDRFASVRKRPMAPKGKCQRKQALEKYSCDPSNCGFPVESYVCGRSTRVACTEPFGSLVIGQLSIRIKVVLKPDEGIAYRCGTIQLHQRNVWDFFANRMNVVAPPTRSACSKGTERAAQPAGAMGIGRLQQDGHRRKARKTKSLARNNKTGCGCSGSALAITEPLLRPRR
jgi:hypothetical protein